LIITGANLNDFISKNLILNILTKTENIQIELLTATVLSNVLQKAVDYGNPERQVVLPLLNQHTKWGWQNFTCAVRMPSAFFRLYIKC